MPPHAEEGFKTMTCKESCKGVASYSKRRSITARKAATCHAFLLLLAFAAQGKNCAQKKATTNTSLHYAYLAIELLLTPPCPHPPLLPDNTPFSAGAADAVAGGLDLDNPRDSKTTQKQYLIYILHRLLKATNKTKCHKL